MKQQNPQPGTPQSAMSGALRNLDNEVSDMLKFLETEAQAAAHLRGIYRRLHSLISKRGAEDYNSKEIRDCITDLSVALHNVKSFAGKAAMHETSAVNYAWRYLAYCDMYDMVKPGTAGKTAAKGDGS